MREGGRRRRKAALHLGTRAGLIGEDTGVRDYTAGGLVVWASRRLHEKGAAMSCARTRAVTFLHAHITAQLAYQGVHRRSFLPEQRGAAATQPLVLKRLMPYFQTRIVGLMLLPTRPRPAWDKGERA